MLELTKAMGVLGVTAYSYDDLLGAHSQTFDPRWAPAIPTVNPRYPSETDRANT